MPTPTTALPAAATSTAQGAVATPTPTLPPSRSGPSKHCAAKLTQLILRASPSAMITLGDTLRFAFDQGISDDALILRIAAALGVEPDGWPLDPVAHRRTRLERFYQFNAIPMDWRKVEMVLAGPHSVDQIVSTLYRKYQRNEIGESLNPDIRLRETLIQIFTRASPDMLQYVDQFVRERASSSMSHEAYLDRVCDALNVCTDGWPLDPNERLRRRLTSFYEKNDPAKLDRVEVLMQRQFTEEEMFAALYEKYGKDELGQPVETERHLREQLYRLLEPTGGEDKIDALIAYKAENRWTDVELHYAVRRLLKLGLDGWPLDPAERIRARVRRFFRVNNNQKRSLQHRKSPSRDTIASFRSAVRPSSLRASPTLESDTPSSQQPPPPPPLLSDEELNLLLHHDSILDELLQEELADIRRRSRGGSSADPVVKSADASPAEATPSASSLDVVSRLTSWILRPGRSKQSKSGKDGGDSTPEGRQQKQLPSLDTLTPEEEELLIERLCVRFRRSELGEVLISDADRLRINEELIPFLERFVRRPRHVHDMAKELSDLRMSEEQIWSTARNRFEHATEHSTFVKLRDHLHVMLRRCAPKDVGKIPKIMRMMYEDDLSPAEVMDTVQRRYRVDAQGWPVEPVQRRKTQLSMLFQRNDPSRLPLIDSLYASIPANAGDDRLYEQLCSEFGIDELGRPVVAMHSVDDDEPPPSSSLRASPKHQRLPSPLPPPQEDPLPSASATYESTAAAADGHLDGGGSVAKGTAVKKKRSHRHHRAGSASPPSASLPNSFEAAAPVDDAGGVDFHRSTTTAAATGVNSSRSPLPTEDARRASHEVHQSSKSRNDQGSRDAAAAAVVGAASVGDSAAVDGTPRTAESATADAIVGKSVGSAAGSAAERERRRFHAAQAPAASPSSQPLPGVTRTLPLSAPPPLPSASSPPPQQHHRANPPAHVAALRTLNARERWNGNEAASAVAFVIGDSLLQHLQNKYGAEEFAWVSSTPSSPPLADTPPPVEKQPQHAATDQRASPWLPIRKDASLSSYPSRENGGGGTSGIQLPSRHVYPFETNPIHSVRKEVDEILLQCSRGVGTAAVAKMSKRRQPVRTALDDMASPFVAQPVPPIVDWGELLPDETKKAKKRGTTGAAVRGGGELPWE